MCDFSVTTNLKFVRRASFYVWRFNQVNVINKIQ